ncbi:MULTISPECIES: signal peptidase II [Paenibacillus]|uniref:signal peptidase II n=1 Tax=Paenibacillus TaxID=44249 RepID=UPI0020403E4D|nr:signal peptidase II [Paenibacillus camelliae]MCM3632219.1 signal peptidase II [Paenibacillus camelliae]
MRILFFIIAIVAFVIDYITKKWIATNMKIGDEFSVIGDFFLITSHRNRGAAFGILQEQRTFFIIITVAIVVGILWYAHIMRDKGSKTLLVGLSLVLGGALGNFIDRVRFGEVVDFFKFNFGSYTFPIFNIADSAIVIGVGLILLDTLLDMRREQKGKVALEHEE